MSRESVSVGGRALDEPQVRAEGRSLHIRLWKRLAVVVLVLAAVVVPAVFGVRAAQIATVPTVLGCLVAVQRLLSHVLWLQRIVRVLAVYPWERRPGLRRRDVTDRSPRSPHVVNLAHASGNWSPEMLASPVLRHRTWEQDMAAEIWFAGDERFGGVVAIPGGRAPMLIRPRQWEALEARRAKASAEDRERAKRAELDRKKW